MAFTYSVDSSDTGSSNSLTNNNKNNNRSSTSTTSTNAPHVSFQILSTTEAHILNQIISRAPTGSSLFNSLLAPYHAVLQENQIEPRLDDRYYSLLLKLSLVEGSDWHQRWSKVCHSQHLSLDGSTTPSGSNNLILPEPSDCSSGDSSSTGGEGSKTIRPRSIHHPHPFSPPLTPDQRNSRANSRILNSQALNPIQSTPNRRRVLQSSPSKFGLDGLSNLKGKRIADESEVLEELGSRFIDPFDALADRFRREFLLRSRFLVWRGLLRLLSESARRAKAREEWSIESKIWSRWRSKFGKRQRLIKMVEGVARTRLKTSMIKRWKEAAVESRKLRWKNQLRLTSNQFKQNRHQTIILDFFLNWKLKTLLSIKIRNQDDLIKHTTLSRWMMLNSRIARSNELAIKYFDEIKCNNERLRILNEWRFKVDLNGRLRNFSFKVENKLMFLGLKRWNYLVSMERLSLKFWVKSKQREVWRVWRRGIKRFKKLHKRANRVISIRDENLASRILYFWIINERGQLLGRIILTRLLRLMISRWMTKLDRVRFYLDAGQQVFRKKLIRREQLKILRRWKNLTIKYQRNLVNQADDRYLISSKAIHFNQWMISFERMRVLSIKAKSHRNFLDLNSRFQSWFVKFRRIRIMKLIKNRKEREIKRVFLEWNFITKRKIKEDSVIFEFNKKLQSNKVLISLRIWRRRLIHLKDLRKKSERQFYDKILKFGLGNWIKKYLKAIEIRDIGLAFFEIQNIEKRDKFFDYWRLRVIESRNLKRCLKEFMTDQNQKLLNRFWNRWNELIIEKKLLLKEEMIVLNLDYRLRSDFFKIWVSRLLPSFNFDRDRLKKRFFRDWVLILRLKEIRDLAILRDRKQVLKEAFRVWWSKCTAIKASRIFSRFSRPSAFNGGKHQRTRSFGKHIESINKISSNNLPIKGNQLGSLTRNQVFKKQMTISSIKQQAAETERFNELQEKETSSEGDIIVSDRDQKIEEVEEVMRYDEEEDGGGGEDDQTVVGDFSENVVVDDPSLETTTTDGGTESDIDIALKNPRRSQWFPRRGRGRSILTSEERVEERVEEPDRKVNSISNRNLILKGLRSFDQSNRGFKNS